MNNNILYMIFLLIILIYYCFYNVENYDDAFIEDNGLDYLNILHEEAKILKKRLDNVDKQNDAGIKVTSNKIQVGR